MCSLKLLLSLVLSRWNLTLAKSTSKSLFVLLWLQIFFFKWHFITTDLFFPPAATIVGICFPLHSLFVLQNTGDALHTLFSSHIKSSRAGKMSYGLFCPLARFPLGTGFGTACILAFQCEMTKAAGKGIISSTEVSWWHNTHWTGMELHSHPIKSWALSQPVIVKIKYLLPSRTIEKVVRIHGFYIKKVLPMEN